jgi:GT2 family glycosyltransferase
MKLLLSVIIVSFNTRDLLKQCLESLEEESERVKEQEIIIVDNGSTDGSVDYLRDLERKKFRNQEKKKSKSLNVSNSLSLKVIFNQRNLGFAKAVNQAIKQSKGEYLLLLNSDIIVKPKAMEKMVEFASKHSEAGVVGGRLLNPDGSVQGSCFYLPTIGRVFREFWLKQKKISVTQKYAPLATKPVEVEAVMGAVFLIPRRILSKVGFFDERYFMYFEDLDYCRRVKKAGFRVYYLPTAEFIHKHGASGKMIPEKTRQWLVESSKIYHGLLKYWLITFIIWSGQKFK